MTTWLWRLAATMAEKRGMTARALSFVERAMEIEYENLPDEINVKAVRADEKFMSLLEAEGLTEVPELKSMYQVE